MANLFIKAGHCLSVHQGGTNRNHCNLALRDRVVNLETSRNLQPKFLEIYSILSGSLLITYVNQLFLGPALQSDAVISMFLTNNSPDLYALTFCA